MRAACWILAAALAAGALSGTASGSTSSDLLLVGYERGSEDAAHASILLAGGTVRRAIPELDVALVETNDPARFTQLVLLSPHVDYVETDDATRLAGAQWNGAQWNGAQWNGAQWNGAQWNGAQWNGAQWNGAQWNGAHGSDAQRAAWKWTIEHFDRSYRYDIEASDPGLVWGWGAWATQAPAAWWIASEGADLCVLDSGVDSDHPDLAANVVAVWNARDPLASGEDDAGHGTHVAGVAAAAVGNAFGVAGVSNARIHSAKVLDANGAGLESDLAIGLVWCAEQGADVAMMALSASSESATLDRAIAFAASRDVLLLASAGNGGGAVEYPASDARVVAVGAIDGRLLVPSFSARGPGLDLVAPGVHILGPLPGGAFAFGSGTSQAVAMAAGAAALVRAHAPGLSAAEVATVLARSARDIGAPGLDPLHGAGLLDVSHALVLARGGSA